MTANATLDEIKALLKQIDKPYVASVWVKAVSNNGDTFGNYMRMINSLPQYKTMDGSAVVDDAGNVEETLQQQQKEEPVEKVKSDYDMKALKQKWGNMWPKEELIAFEDFYQEFTKTMSLTTAQQVEFAIIASINNVKAKKAISEGDISNAKKYMEMFQDATKAGKLQPAQLTKLDLQGGLNTFGELLKRVEQALDIIPILPQFVMQPQDDVDFTIWCYVNYIRNLQGLPECEYKDIYAYIEQRKKDFEESQARAKDGDEDAIL